MNGITRGTDRREVAGGGSGGDCLFVGEAGEVGGQEAVLGQVGEGNRATEFNYGCAADFEGAHQMRKRIAAMWHKIRQHFCKDCSKEQQREEAFRQAVNRFDEVTREILNDQHRGQHR